MRWRDRTKKRRQAWDYPFGLVSPSPPLRLRLRPLLRLGSTSALASASDLDAASTSDLDAASASALDVDFDVASALIVAHTLAPPPAPAPAYGDGSPHSPPCFNQGSPRGIYPNRA